MSGFIFASFPPRAARVPAQTTQSHDEDKPRVTASSPRKRVQWKHRFDELARLKTVDEDAFRALDGTSPVGKWLQRQRVLRRSGGLPDSREKQLANLGVTWEPREMQWERHYVSLMEFHTAQGHCDVPQSAGSLGRWLELQRTFARQNRLPSHRKFRLGVLGVKWDVTHSVWEQHLAELEEYAAVHGDCLVPQSHRALGAWVHAQRISYNEGRLEETRRQSLEDLGFVWDPRSLAWNENFEELREFYERHSPSSVVPVKKYSLRNWVRNQRAAYASGRLTPERVGLLKTIGFIFEPRRRGR